MAAWDDYDELTDPASGDMLLIRDVSDNGVIAQGKVKQVDLSHVGAEIASDQGLAPLASPAFTGNPAAPTQTAGNNSTRLATTAYADASAAARAAVAGDIGGTAAAPKVTGIGGFAVSTGQAWGALGASHSEHLANWLVALALGDQANVVVGCVGDSFTSGNQAGLTFAQTWPCLLQKRLNARYPSSVATGQGRGMLPPIDPGATVDLSAFVTLSGNTNPEVWWGHGFSAAANIADTGSGACTITYTVNGDNAVIAYYQQPSGGSFTYTVDGGSPTTVSTAAGAPAAAIEVVSFGSAGAHTIVIAWVAASGNTVIQGVAEFNGDFAAGLQVWNAALSGSKASDWEGYDWFQWNNTGLGLLIVELGASDLLASVPAATYKTSLLAVIAAARAATSASLSVLLVAPPFGTSGWDAYVAEMYSVAAADGLCDILDLTSRIPLGNTFVFNSGELTAAGHVMTANAVASFLSPQ